MHNPPLILTIDDDLDLLDIVATRLRQAGFEVEKANDAITGMGMAVALKPDLILLDIQMPGMNGTQALLDLKNDPATAGIPVVFLTSLAAPWPAASSGNDKFSRELGATEFLDKTKDLDDVGARVGAILHRSK